LARRNSWLLFGTIAAAATFLTNAYARTVSPKTALPLLGFATFVVCAASTGWIRETVQARSAFVGGAAVGLLSGIALVVVASLSINGTFLTTTAWRSTVDSSLVIAPAIVLSFSGIFVAGIIAEGSAYLARRQRSRKRIRSRPPTGIAPPFIS